jgi:hypothetical protein
MWTKTILQRLNNDFAEIFAHDRREKRGKFSHFESAQEQSTQQSNVILRSFQRDNSCRFSFI